MFESIFVLVGFAAAGACLLAAGWFAFGEYRKVFLQNPRLIMSLEVFSVIAQRGGLGYFAAVLVLVGGWMVLNALYAGVSLTYAVLTT